MGKRNCNNQSFNNVVVRNRGVAVFYGPMIRNWSFGEAVPLDYDLY